MFGSTKCGKCGKSTFKVSEIEPQGSSFKLIAVQCSGCGTPFGVTDFYNAGALFEDQNRVLQKQSAEISKLSRQVREIGDAVDKIAAVLRR